MPQQGDGYVVRKGQGRFILHTTSLQNRISSISCDNATMCSGDVVCMGRSGCNLIDAMASAHNNIASCKPSLYVYEITCERNAPRPTHSQAYCIHPSGQIQHSPSVVAMNTCRAAGSCPLSAPHSPAGRSTPGTGQHNPDCCRRTDRTGLGVVAVVESDCRSDRASWSPGWHWPCHPASCGRALPWNLAAAPN